MVSNTTKRNQLKLFQSSRELITVLFALIVLPILVNGRVAEANPVLPSQNHGLQAPRDGSCHTPHFSVMRFEFEFDVPNDKNDQSVHGVDGWELRLERSLDNDGMIPSAVWQQAVTKAAAGVCVPRGENYEVSFLLKQQEGILSAAVATVADNPSTLLRIKVDGNVAMEKTLLLKDLDLMHVMLTNVGASAQTAKMERIISHEVQGSPRLHSRRLQVREPIPNHDLNTLFERNRVSVSLVLHFPRRPISGSTRLLKLQGVALQLWLRSPFRV